MSSNPTLSPTVRRRKQTLSSVVRQKEPKPKKDTVYIFSNGRRFQLNHNELPPDYIA